MAQEPFLFRYRPIGRLQEQKLQGYARVRGKPSQFNMHRTLENSPMGNPRLILLVFCALLIPWAGTPSYSQAAGGLPPGQQPQSADKQASSKAAPQGIPALPRGKKLVLKDGGFQLVRDYARNGDRVRYLSAERGEWEEIPASMVDWDATAKAAAEEQTEEDALSKKIHAQEQAQRIETIMDVDASLQVAPGVFLPPGEGMFLIDGKYVMHLEQVGSQIKTDKKQFLKQVLSPIPIVPSKRNVEIPGSHATIRVSNSQAEFYLREAPPDPERATPILKSSRPGESGPEVELVRATVKGSSRQLESIRSLFGEELEQKRTTISIQRWEVARTVFRFTLSEPLPPGEYALAEILPDGMNMYVWDFGVDPAKGAKPATPQKTKN
jgi:hypothetical protein